MEIHDIPRTCITEAMNRLPAVILGVPFYSLSIDEAAMYVFDLMDRSYGDGKTRLVCVADMERIVDALCGKSDEIPHSEFLSTLRRADMVTGEYAPAVRMSRFLGPALKECILSGDLVCRIVQEAVRRWKSIYILGHRAESLKNSLVMLEDSFPGLKVAGWDTLSAPTEGRGHVEAHGDDSSSIVDNINASSADILFISLGSPEQEIWFDRNRERLQVPVCICVGDIDVSVARSELCTPAWMRNAGMEKLFYSNRKQECIRKYSLINHVKFWLLILPSILLHQYVRAVSQKTSAKKSTGKISYRYWMRGAKEIFSLTLPGVIDSENARRLIMLVPKNPDSHLVLDYSSVTFIDSAGLGFLLHLFLLWGRGKYEVLQVGLSRYVKKTLFYNRMHGGSIHTRQFSSLDEMLAYLDARTEGHPV